MRVTGSRSARGPSSIVDPCTPVYSKDSLYDRYLSVSHFLFLISISYFLFLIPGFTTTPRREPIRCSECASVAGSQLQMTLRISCGVSIANDVALSAHQLQMRRQPTAMRGLNALASFRTGLYRRSTFYMALCICVGIVVFLIFVIELQGRRENISRVEHMVLTTGSAETKKKNVTVKVKSLNESVMSLLAILSKSLVVRRAYFDYRKRDDFENAVVFIMEIKRSIPSKMFTGCRVGDIQSSNVNFRYAKQYDWAIEKEHVTKNIALIDCYDVHGTKDGDPAYLILENYKIGSAVIQRVEVRSRQNVVVPLFRNFSNSAPTVVTCIATVRSGKISPSADGVLYHWLQYQKAIGVDHVHMIAEDTFVSAGGMDNSYIQDAVKENYLSIDFWPRWFNETEIYHSSQHLAYNDCLYRFMGTYDYVVFADSDDFFVPVKTSKSIKTYLTKWCSGKTATCNFKWKQFYPDCGWNPESVGADGNLTAIIYYTNTTKRRESKCGHQTRALVDVGVHSAKVLMPNYRGIWVPSYEAYFAHLRKGNTPHGGC